MDRLQEAGLRKTTILENSEIESTIIILCFVFTVIILWFLLFSYTIC